MKKIQLGVLFAALLFCSNSGVFAANPKKPVDRLKKIKEIVDAYAKAGEDLTDPDVKKSVYKDVSKMFKLDPKKKPENKTTRELADLVRDEVEKKFPESPKQVREAARKQADKQFKLCEPMTPVTVYYQRGDQVFKVQGVFYEYGGNSVLIGDRYVAIFDLLPQYRVMFDKAFCEKKKKEFVKKELKAYYMQKQSYSTQKYKDIKSEMARRNESAGYIYAWKSWRTPREVTDILLYGLENGDGDKKKIDVTKAIKKRDESQKEKVVEKKVKREENKKVEDGSEKKELTPLDKLKAKAEQELVRIANTYAGIDADQGYKMATWGMTREDVDLLLDLDKNRSAANRAGGKKDDAIPNENTSDTINFKSGPIESVKLYFYYGIFQKVDIQFRIGPPEAMRQLSMRLNDRYGMTDEQKKVLAEQEAKKRQGSALDRNAEFEKNKPIPKRQTYHWTGKVTLGTLEIKLDDKNTPELFVLTKESPKIKKEVTLIIERQKKEKEEEAKRKKLREYKKKIDF